MPDQRKIQKRSIGGYVAEELKEKIQATGMDVTGFLELCIVRGLLVRKCITKAELKKMAEGGRLRATTILSLQDEKLW